MADNDAIRPGEVTATLPDHPDAGIYFIGRIRTPWLTRESCPKRGEATGPLCQIEVESRWVRGLEGLAAHPRIQVLYWMHLARRDLVLQSPMRTGRIHGTFALRSPVRPNPIASSEVDVISIDGGVVTVRGLDCLDGTWLIDLKPLRTGT